MMRGRGRGRASVRVPSSQTAPCEMASVRSPKSMFLSSGKVRGAIATLMGGPLNQLKFKVLCKFSEKFEAAEFVRSCQETGPCLILIQKPFSSKVLGGFTRMGWGTQYGTNHVDREAFLFKCSSDFAPQSVRKFTSIQHVPAANVLWQQGGPAFNDDLVVTEGGVSSKQTTFHINSEFIEEANTGGGPFKLEVLAVWNSAWGAPEGIEHWRGNWQNNLSEDAWLPGISWDEKVICLLSPHRSWCFFKLPGYCMVLQLAARLCLSTCAMIPKMPLAFY